MPSVPSTVRWSELIHAGIRSAIQVRAFFSTRAVKLSWIRTAFLNPGSATLVVAAVMALGNDNTEFSDTAYLQFFAVRSLCAAVVFTCCVATALRVELSVKTSDSRGMLSTNPPTIHPSPLGTSRVSEIASHCAYTPLSRSTKRQYVLRRQRNPWVLAWLQSMLARFVGVFDLDDSSAVGPAVCPRWTEPREVDVVIGIEQDGNHLVLAQAQRDLEVIVTLRKHSRCHYLRRVCRFIMLIILEHREHLVDGRGREKRSPTPVMKQCAGQVFVERIALLDKHLASSELLVG